MHYDAITFETVETNSFRFDGGLLSQLKQFKDGPVRVVVSEIVAREKHLVEKARAATDAAAAAQREDPFISKSRDSARPEESSEATTRRGPSNVGKVQHGAAALFVFGFVPAVLLFIGLIIGGIIVEVALGR